MAMQYGTGGIEIGGVTEASNVGTQFNTEYWVKKSLIEVAPKAWFSQLSNTEGMPKHYGKKIKKYLYLPLLDDRNINDQGIDATGAVITNGNLYGSSRDVGTITKLLPTLTEQGGRVNRVSFTRLTLEGSFEEFGFFYEYTEDALMFDTDAELRKHNIREAIRGANRLYEDTLQADLLNGAGTILYGGDATSVDTVTGEAGGAASVVSYGGLLKLELKLDELDVPTDTKIIKGSTFTDTVTVSGGRYAYVGTAVIPSLYRLTNYHGASAFQEVREYASAGSIAHGEVGAIGGFRFIKVAKEMQHWEAKGAVVGSNGGNAGYRTSLDPVSGDEKYNVYPILVVGNGSFTTISFKNGQGGSNKFEYFDQAPKPAIRHSSDPYGKIGFSVISWWYGTLIERPERLALIKVVAEK